MESETLVPVKTSTTPLEEKLVASILKAEDAIASPVTEVGEKEEKESVGSDTVKTESHEKMPDKKDETTPVNKESNKDEILEHSSEVSAGTVLVEEKEEKERTKEKESASYGATATESDEKVHDNKVETTVIEDRDKEEHGINSGSEVSVGIGRNVKESANSPVVVAEKEELEMPKEKKIAGPEPTTAGSDDKTNGTAQNCEEKEKEADCKNSGSEVPVDVREVEPGTITPSIHVEKEVVQIEHAVQSPTNETIIDESDKKFHDKGDETQVEEATKKEEDNKDSCSEGSVNIKKDEEEIASPPTNTGEKKPVAVVTESEENEEKTPVVQEKNKQKNDENYGPEVLPSLAISEADVATPLSNIDHIEVECPDNKESPNPEIVDKESDAVVHVKKDDITPIEEKANTDDHRDFTSENSAENGLTEENNVVASGLETAVEVVEKQIDKQSIDTLQISDEKVDKPQVLSEPISSREVVQEMREEPEVSGNTADGLVGDGVANQIKEAECGRTTEDILVKEAEAVVGKDSLPDETLKVSEKSISESFNAVVSESADPAEHKESLSDVVSKVEEAPKSDLEANGSVEDIKKKTSDIIPLEGPVQEEIAQGELPDLSSAICVTKAIDTTCVTKVLEEFVKPEDKDFEDKVETVASDISHEVEEVPVCDCSALVIQNNSVMQDTAESAEELIEGTKREDVKEDVKKSLETSNETVNESKEEFQVKQEGSMQADCHNLEKEETKGVTEKTIEKTLIESFKDENDPKPDIEITKEEHHAESTHHSSNIISKVKHSIVKVKKKILGKSPSSKNASSEVKT